MDVGDEETRTRTRTTRTRRTRWWWLFLCWVRNRNMERSRNTKPIDLNRGRLPQLITLFYMIFTTRETTGQKTKSTSTWVTPPPAITLGGNPFEVVEETKLLDVTKYSHLNWEEHVSRLVKSAFCQLYLLRRLKTLGAPAHELKAVYITIIMPRLKSASLAWSCSINTTQHRQMNSPKPCAAYTGLHLHYLSQGPQHYTYPRCTTTTSPHEAIRGEIAPPPTPP